MLADGDATYSWLNESLRIVLTICFISAYWRIIGHSCSDKELLIMLETTDDQPLAYWQITSPISYELEIFVAK